MTNKPNHIALNKPDLLSFEQAQKTILALTPTLEDSQQIPIEQANARCLAETVTSPIEVPRHTNSAVDGYALSASDLPAPHAISTLIIQDTLLAGQIYTKNCQPGYCLHIMTGAAIPRDLDTVIMQEHCKVTEKTIQIDDQHKIGQNIRQAGEDIALGAIILKPGKFLMPADIGLLASLGIAEIKVIRKIRIAIASTGNETYDISAQLPEGGLYDSNRYCLLAALDRTDIEIISLGIVADQEAELLQCFNEAAKYADIIISTGGVSIGAADYTKMVLADSGQVNFWKVAVKPGRPIAFGNINQSIFFGLPGNPVAALVSFYQLVLPSIEKMLGITNKPIAPLLKARCLEPLRKIPGRTEIQRGIISQSPTAELLVQTTGTQGSGILSSISIANCFIILKHDQGHVEKGDWVDVQLFSGLV